VPNTLSSNIPRENCARCKHPVNPFPKGGMVKDRAEESAEAGEDVSGDP